MTSSEKVPSRFNAAVARLDGDVGLLCEMAAITSEDLPEVQRQTEMAISEGDCSQAASGLHKLKGMLSTFESDGVVLEIQEMLDSARQGAAEEVRQAYDQHRDQIQELIDQLGRLADDA